MALKGTQEEQLSISGGGVGGGRLSRHSPKKYVGLKAMQNLWGGVTRAIASWVRNSVARQSLGRDLRVSPRARSLFRQ